MLALFLTNLTCYILSIWIAISQSTRRPEQSQPDQSQPGNYRADDFDPDLESLDPKPDFEAKQTTRTNTDATLEYNQIATNESNRNSAQKSNRLEGGQILIRFGYPLLIFITITIHAVGLYLTHTANGEINLSLGRSISIAAWMSITCYWAIWMFNPRLSLGIIMLPIGLIGLIIGYGFPGPQIDGLDSKLLTHITLAVPTYGFLCLAFAQAVLLFIQERRLHNLHSGSVLKFLPAIETMERTLFWLTYVGFSLLTINLVGGILLSLNQPNFSINHHILLSFVAWFCFAFLIIGRSCFGWRGAHAAKWTMVSFVILVLGYFGTRFVRDVILG